MFSHYVDGPEHARSPQPRRTRRPGRLIGLSRITNGAIKQAAAVIPDMLGAYGSGEESGRIEMRILFITEHRYLPQYLGGMQTTADNLCHGLMKRGHHVSILASFARQGFFGWRCTLERKMLGRSVL